MTDNRYTNPTDHYWYPKPDDLIGGHCVMLGNYTPATAPIHEYERDGKTHKYQEGAIADFCSREVAMYIARIHNQNLHERKQRKDPNHDSSSCFCCCFDCPEDLDKG